MFNIQQFINEIIPPADYQHREGFTNARSIDRLNEEEKGLVEDALIQRFSVQDPDDLIITTLTYLRSEKALPSMYKALQFSQSAMIRIIVATSIFQLNKDYYMIDITGRALKELDENRAYRLYTLPTAFYYLSETNNVELNRLVGKYINDKDYLISYNAKRHFRENPNT